MSLKTNNYWVVLERDPVVLGDWTGRCLDPGVFALGASLSMVVRRLGHEIGRPLPCPGSSSVGDGSLRSTHPKSFATHGCTVRQGVI
jgi:hypothetical protein